MKKRRIVFKFAGVPIYESDLSKEAVARLNKELVNQFNNAHRELTKTAIAEVEILTAKTLKEMLLITLKKGYDLNVIEVILSNPNLEEIDEGSWKDLSKHESWAIRKIAAQSRFATEERLKEMLKHEVKAGKNLDSDVIKAILSNPNLEEIDEESWKDLSEHRDWEIKEIAAQSRFATEERLKEMLKHEVKAGENLDLDVIVVILSNPNMKEIDEENWENLSKHKYWRIRRIAARFRFATEKKLQEMLDYELKTGKDSDVIKEILSNLNLEKIDEESWKNLSKHESWAIRGIAAKSRFATEERLKEMLKCEVKVGKDSDVIKAIISNPNFKNDEETSS